MRRGKQCPFQQRRIAGTSDARRGFAELDDEPGSVWWLSKPVRQDYWADYFQRRGY